MTYKEAREYMIPIVANCVLPQYAAALEKAMEALELAERNQEVLNEDTGLTPEEVNGLKLKTESMEMSLRVACDALEKFTKAEQEGRLVVLPCKVGDILYYFPKWYARIGYEPEPISVEEVNSFNGNIVVECYMDPDTRLSILPTDFGKTVFLTREEAEAALKGEYHG